MAGPYGDLDEVRAVLRAKPGDVFNADQEARLAQLQLAVTAHIEQETGRRFGVAPAAVAVLVEGTAHQRLLLPEPVSSVSAVVRDPGWDGAAWTGGWALTTADWRLALPAGTGEWLALEAVTGWSWPGSYLVTAVWGSADVATVPDDIAYLANHLIAERWKVETASPAGMVGENGFVVPIRNVFKDPLVVATLDRWRVAPRVAF